MRINNAICLTATFMLASNWLFVPVFGANAAAFNHNKKGIELAKAGKIDEAIAEVKQAEKLDPSNADYHNNLSSLYTAQNRPTEALQEARLAVKYRPTEARSNVNLGNLALAEKDYATAEKAFRIALKSDPNNADALIGMTGILRAQKKNDEAEKMGRKAAATTKGAGDPQLHLILGGIFKDQRKYKEAIAQYQTVLNLAPDHPDAKQVQDQINYLKAQTEPIHK